MIPAHAFPSELKSDEIIDSIETLAVGLEEKIAAVNGVLARF